MEEKKERLKALLDEYTKGNACLAFSGGIDSSLILKLAQEAADRNGTKLYAVTFDTVLHPKADREIASRVARENHSIHEIISVDELKQEEIRFNPKNRCYLCKKELFEKIWKIAKEEHVVAIAEGSNLDDNGDYRPGLQAVAELGIKSPLRASKLNKDDIRALSKDLGLPTWNKQSFACLSSRFVYGETISEEKLIMVDKAEQLLLDMGFHQVRVRIHGTIARIEILPEEFPKLVEETNRNLITKSFKEYGFTYVTMDLTGYRTGSMNETLNSDFVPASTVSP